MAGTRLPSYIRAVHRFRTDCTGVLSAKLFWYDVEETIREQQRDAGEGDAIESAGDAASNYPGTSALGQIFPNPTFVHLSRRDRVRNAVRHWSPSRLSGGGISNPLTDARTTDVTYDYDRILRLIALGDHCQAQWPPFRGKPHHAA